MSTEESITSCVAMSWDDEMSREGLLVMQIRQLERHTKGLKLALEKIEARLCNKGRFDQTYRLCQKKMEGD